MKRNKENFKGEPIFGHLNSLLLNAKSLKLKVVEHDQEIKSGTKRDISETDQVYLDFLLSSIHGNLKDLAQALKTAKDCDLNEILYTVADAARKMKIQEATLRNLLSKKKIRYIKFCGRTLIPESALRENMIEHKSLNTMENHV